MKKAPVYIYLHPSTNAANEFMDALICQMWQSIYTSAF